jgi:hypothetical protein
MKRIVLLPVSLFLFGGCSAAHHGAVAQAPIGPASMHVIPRRFEAEELEENPYVAKGSADPRQVGDYITTEFAQGSGKKAITTQQRILARDGTTSVVEVAIKDGAHTQLFRLRTAAGVAGEQVLDVTRVQNGIEHASTLAAYEAAMQRTVPNVERNDGVLDSEPVTVDVGGRKVDATRTTYKVSYNGKAATMSVVHADGFAWGDLGGDIVADDGKVLFSTHIVEAGSDRQKAVADR